MTTRPLVIALMVFAVQAHAQQYRWVDEKGRVQYTDTPPPPSAKSVQKKHLDAPKGEGPAESFAIQMARKAAPIKLYTSPDCGNECDTARAHLNKRGIPFTEVSVVYDSQAAELKALSGRASVPVMLVGTKMIRGYDDSTFNNAFDVAGYPKEGTVLPRNQSAPPPPPRKGDEKKAVLKPPAGEESTKK